MHQKNEIEIVRHSQMNQLEIFIVEMISRAPHGHDDLEFGIILDGSMNLFFENNSYPVKKKDIYIINRFQVHSFQCLEHKARILAFQIRPDFYQNINPSLSFLKFENNILHSGVLKSTLSDLLLSCADQYFHGDLEGQIQCSSLLLSAFAQLLRQSHYSISNEQESITERQNTLRLNRIMQYIAENYQDKITLDDLAAMENITTYHMSHFITSMLGVSFQQYLNQVRFEHALHLIHNTNLTATDICMTVGFSSTRYLNKMLEESCHCSYKEYKKAKEKPCMDNVTLPTENQQVRLSFDQSALMLSKNMIIP